MTYDSIILASSIPLVIYLGHKNRQGNETDKTKGIGWQFIRYTVLTI